MESHRRPMLYTEFSVSKLIAVSNYWLANGQWVTDQWHFNPSSLHQINALGWLQQDHASLAGEFYFCLFPNTCKRTASLTNAPPEMVCILVRTIFQHKPYVSMRAKTFHMVYALVISLIRSLLIPRKLVTSGFILHEDGYICALLWVRSQRKGR